MSKLLLLYGYNNYFNRIIKKESTIEAYKNAVGTGNFVELNNTNFNITDGVNARHVFNVSSTLDEKSPDYLIRVKSDGTLERWFVLEAVKIMGNQIQVTLRRDIIADFYNNISTAKAFIKKGMLPYNSPLIFNKENMTFNQIKKKELLLKDNTKIPWIIGYIARNDNEGEVLERDVTIESEIPVETIPYEDLDEEIKNIIDNQITVLNGSEITKTILGHYFTWSVTGVTAKDVIQAQITTNKGFINQSTAIAVNTTNNPTAANSYKGYPVFLSSDYATARDRILNCWKYNGGFGLINALNNEYKNEIQNRVRDDFIQYNGLYYLKNDKLFKITITQTTGYYLKEFNINNLTGNIGTKLNTYLDELTHAYGFSNNNVNDDVNFIGLKGEHAIYNITITEEYYAKAHTKISKTRNQLYDAPYDMIAIPWGTAENPGIAFGNYISQKEYALSGARSIALALTNLYCYDFQILPYCPVESIRNNGEIDLTNLTIHEDFDYIYDEQDNPVSIIIYCKKSSGSFNIELDTSDYEELEEKNEAVEKKIASETNIIRFVSPNFGSVYEINAQKNEGINVVNVDYNYKPYQPYIHIAPIYKGLYGEDFNDPKGLILSGDFSIATTSSKWEEYQVQNKNYNLIFDRQIENLDVNNQITLEQTQTLAKINTATAFFSGATGGALAGGTIGGGIGAGVGAAVGGISSAIASGIGAKKDIEYLVRQQTENRDYAVDMYQYQLGNVKALPNTLNKVSAYNENNKIFPFIEIYDCTDIEKQNLRDKIKYNGMTVMVEGTISEYVISSGDYIQAELIRLEGIHEDNHLITEIYNELMRGVYIYA